MNNAKIIGKELIINCDDLWRIHDFLSRFYIVFDNIFQYIFLVLRNLVLDVYELCTVDFKIL